MSPEDICYKISTATFDDVLQHLVKCNENFIPALNEKVDIKAYSQKIAKNSITFEAWINDELSGLIAAYFNDGEKKKGFITNVSTIKAYSGKGIASQLMEMCISYGVRHKFGEITLEVFQYNKSAIQLYKKYGFHQTGDKDNLVIMKRKLSEL